MAGTFSKTARPKRPGAYFNFVAAEQQPVLENTRGIVAIPFVHDWGPVEQVVEVTGLPDFNAKFGGASIDGVTYSDGYRAVAGAFQGEGLPGRGGASQVLAYRMVGTDAAYASRALSNTTPATALTVQGRYQGSFGNRLKVEVIATPGVAGSKDLIVYDGSTELERFTHAETDIDALAAAIRADSNWIDYTGSVTSGVALANLAATALTGGDDGDTIVQADYTAAQAAFEPWRFSLFAAANLTDTTTLAALVAWVQGLNVAGKRFMAVVGGAAGESGSTAVTRSGTIDDPNIINVGIGTYEDERLGELSTAQLAPRVAGVIARLGEDENLTFTRLAGLTIVDGATNAEILAAIEGGVVTFTRDSHPTAPVRIEKGITSFTTADDDDRPLSIYSVPKFVRTIHGIETDLTSWAEEEVIGRVPVTDASREYVRAQMEARMAVREEAGAIQPGWSVSFDSSLAPTAEDDFVALTYQFKFARSLEQILNTVVVG